MDFNDEKTALVTGGGTGVGRACVLQLAASGFDIFLCYSRSIQAANVTVDEAKELGVQAHAIQCDVSDDSQVRAMISEIANHTSSLDVLINNAGTTDFVDQANLEALIEPMWDRAIGVNLKGPFFVTRAASELLRAGDGGAVINVSSVAGLTGVGSSIAYAASKGGLNTMTKSLARVLAPKVRVNAVCPGPIDSRWIKEGIPNWDLNKMVEHYPIPKASSPDDIADGVLYFALGSSTVTGQILSIDGGQTLSSG